MDLFDHQRELLIDVEAPLAARMRPRTLNEFVGQGAIGSLITLNDNVILWCWI